MSDAFGGYPACCFVAVIAVSGVMHHSISILGGTIGGRRGCGEDMVFAGLSMFLCGESFAFIGLFS